MGQTLPHGVYLPDEGERNCYNGLAANWSILDGAVGTVAEHTAALSGKAPLVHTHVKADITDFPVYGNTAGTICEGNDSRLSDARTPVAHTHTKSGVTDLLNSNFIPSANNSYDLGSSSYQWNSLYAKNYFYKGTQWGLDQSNIWTGANNFYKSIQIHGGRDAYIMPEFGASYSGLTFGTVEFKQSFKFGDWVDNNSIIGLNMSNAYVEIYAGLASSDGVNKARLNPVNTTEAELGTSTYKWKTINGINPGALSLPDTATTDASGDIVPPSGESSINLSGGANTYTPSNNGWLTLAINCASRNCIIVRQNTSNRETLNYMQGYVSGQTNIYLTIPVLAGVTYYIFLYATSFVMARFALCQGNV